MTEMKQVNAAFLGTGEGKKKTRKDFQSKEKTKMKISADIGKRKQNKFGKFGKSKKHLKSLSLRVFFSLFFSAALQRNIGKPFVD